MAIETFNTHGRGYTSPEATASNLHLDERHETKERKPADEKQLVVANALAYLDYVDILDAASTNYAHWKTDNRRGQYSHNVPRKDDVRNLKQKANYAMDDLFFASSSPDKEEALKRFKRDWDEDADGISQVFGRFADKIEAAKQARLEAAADLSPAEIQAHTKQIIKRIRKLPNAQGDKLQEISEINPEQRVQLRRDLIQRGLMTTALYSAMYWGSDYLSDFTGITLGQQYDIFSNSYGDWRVMATLGAIEVAYYGTEVLKYLQTKRMVKDPQMTVYHPMAKAAHEIATHTTEDPQAIDKAIFAGYMANPQLYVQFLKWYAAAPFSPTVFITGDAAATALNLVHLAGVELEHRRVHRNDNAMQVQVTETPPPSANS